MSALRNRIWSELTQSKHNIEFASIYCDIQRKRIRIFNLVVLIFSSGGVMGWKLWDNLPTIACVIIAAISLIRLAQPQIIMDNKMLKNLDDIHRFYVDYFNQLEALWFNFESEKLKDDEAQTEFYRLKQLESDINPMVAETIRSKPKRIVRICKKHSDEYFNQVFKS